MTDKAGVENRGQIEAPTAPVFQARTIDNIPELMEQSYRLRYQVYCLERQFLDADAYPTEQERDEFDDHSVHVGVVDRAGELAGTARLVRTNAAGLPLLRHCTLFSDETLLSDPRNIVVEVSRLSISRRYTRRRGDDSCGPPQVFESEGSGVGIPGERRRAGNLLFVTLLQAFYQAAKRLSATHWIAATEPSLQRRLAQFGLPSRQVGPETEYWGRVAAYAMSIADFDQVILHRHFAALDDFLVGLEPQFTPVLEPKGAVAAPLDGMAPFGQIALLGV
jgi:N-acyl amino acid synthase of PEP-CTERM/exosortase system